MKSLTPLSVAALTVFALSLSAQDVTVKDLVPYPYEPQVDELPRRTARLRPEYPPEMRKAPELGYGVIIQCIGENGKDDVLIVEATHLPFKRAIEADTDYRKLKPAMSHGHPTTLWTWTAIIFNPASANGTAAESMPRLLSIEPAFIISDHHPKIPRAVTANLSLDAQGNIVAMRLEGEPSSSVRTAIEKALKAWKFQPARHAGSPVTAEISVPVLCFGATTQSSADSTPPRVTRQAPPEYPFEMRRYGLAGEVMIDFNVSTDGNVVNPTVYRSTNPAFDEPALKAIQQWKFIPGSRGGKPASTHMQVPIIFQLDGGGRSAFEIRGGDSSKLPPEFQYDARPKIRNVQIPVYPYSLLREGAAGKATLAVVIGPTGDVVSVKVTGSDRPEFALALTAAVEGFKFDPALNRGKPVPFVFKFEQEFSRYELPDEEADDLLRLEMRHPDRIASAAKLDGRLKPVSRRAPIFPLTATSDSGEAVVECLIDDTGHARLPRVVNATDPAFGYAAVQAANAWWFDPPTVNGKPVVTRVQIPFEFNRAVAPDTKQSNQHRASKDASGSN